MTERPRILVMGCGGIGGVVASFLAELPVDLRVVTRNQAVIDAVRERGLRRTGVSGDRTTRVPDGTVTSELLPDEVFDYVLLAVQPPDVEAAARRVQGHLAAEGRVVCFQNGLCEERVAKVLGDRSKVVGGIITWGASTSSSEPGLFEKTSLGAFILGRLDGPPDRELRVLGRHLSKVSKVKTMVKYTDNLAGARWSKLAMNSAVSSLGTLAGTNIGTWIRNRRARRLALEVVTEAVAVGEACGIEFERLGGTIDLHWFTLRNAERRRNAATLAPKHGMVLGFGLKYRRLRSSMLRAILAGKPPSVDFLNGEVVSRGKELGIPTPVNEAIVERIWALSRGELEPRLQNIDELYAATRDPSRSASEAA